MWKTLKEVIRGEAAGLREINNIDFEILKNVEECTLANKFNIFYIQSIKDIIESIRKYDSNNSKIIYAVESRSIIEMFEAINIQKLDQIVMALPQKKGTDEGISKYIKNELSRDKE